MNAKIVKSTTKGQITLPKEWRSQFETDNFILEMDNKKIVVTPLNIQSLKQDEVLFDADQDNDGKGISPDAIIKALKKIQNG